MLRGLLSAILETLLSVAWDAIVRFFRLEIAVELTTAFVGLSCIVIGFAAFLLDH
ncbi:hypothetical protein [Bradyrhizobium guangdongense]|uniref:hypothetical protein n=1 Tax=Bradyrhizobium guangdongense TaxID=1325090 RepID=UPI001319BB15|nr:hypothetical protein [Bradyrhizobium guangdongense]